MNISPYKEAIKKLDPMIDSSFQYNPDRWKNLSSENKVLVCKYENISISRYQIIVSFRQYYQGLHSWQIPFILTMIWGFAKSGYGNHRTNNFLAFEENKIFIPLAFEAVKNGNLKLAYEKLQSIKGLNVSYISKLLYFATRACNYTDYALIYDIRVASSLIKLTTTPEIFEIVKVNPSSKFSHYEKYISLIHNCAMQNDVQADALELFLFNQIF